MAEKEPIADKRLTPERQAALDMLAQLNHVTPAEAFTAITILTVSLARSAGVLTPAQRAVFMDQMTLALRLQFAMAETVADAIDVATEESKGKVLQ